MSLQELEKKIRHLDETELLCFGVWFDRYRESHVTAAGEEDADLSPKQRAELDRRLEALDADPALAVPWEGTMDEVKRIREKLRAEKAVGHRP